MRTEKEAHNFFGTFKGLKAQAALESNCDSTDLSTHRQMVHSNCCSSRTARPLHAQAALEYLITYGWALLVIVIVIAALVVINPISTPASCSFPTGFNCPNIPAIDTNGSLYVRVVNSNNNEITVLRAICTEDKSMTPPNPSIGATPSQILVARQSMLSIEPGGALSAICYQADGTSHTYQIGEEFTGRLWLFYRNTEDPSTYPNRTVVGIISTKIG